MRHTFRRKQSSHKFTCCLFTETCSGCKKQTSAFTWGSEDSALCLYSNWSAFVILIRISLIFRSDFPRVLSLISSAEARMLTDDAPMDFYLTPGFYTESGAHTDWRLRSIIRGSSSYNPTHGQTVCHRIRRRFLFGSGWVWRVKNGFAGMNYSNSNSNINMAAPAGGSHVSF